MSQHSFAFVTAVTRASQTIYSQYDYYTGKPVDGQDANGIISSGYYDDALDRPTKVIKNVNNADTKSRTLFAYDDDNRTVTTTGDFASFEDGKLKSVVLYDGLGRVYETHAYESSTDYITTKQEFDPLGRMKRTSNPYRSSETVYWTTSAYDALGRITSVTTDDSAVVSTAYSGNAVTVTDQASNDGRQLDGSVTSPASSLTTLRRTCSKGASHGRQRC